MSVEIRRDFYANSWGSGSVVLRPEPGSETLPSHLDITQIQLTLTNATPDVDFFRASGSGCGRYRVIIQKLV